MKKIRSYLPLSLMLILVLGAAGCFNRTANNVVIDQTTPIVLQYDRLFDESTALDEIVKLYQEDHPNITVVVRKVSLKPGETVYDYQADLIKQVADGNGPDMFMIHNDWLPYNKNHISPMPAEMMSTQTYSETFYPVVVNDFVDANRIYAIPYYLDNLMLFYNTNIFDELNIKQPPKTWQEVVDLVPKLTKYGSGDTIKQSAIPLGTAADSIPRFAEILAALIMQYGGEMTTTDHTKATFDLSAPNSDPAYFSGREALKFYTDFANPSSSVYTYTDAKNNDGSLKFPMDVQAFMEGKAAMMIGYSYQVANIRKFAPNLTFETTSLPQLRQGEPLTVANYWGETVSKNCAHPNEAWDFIKFVIKNQGKYSSASKRVPATKESNDAYVDRQYYGPVASQAANSTSWYRHNSPEVEAIFGRMVTSVLHDGVAVSTAIDTAARDINQLAQD
ncbi:MAG: extracellular solute-binding protein [Patescibacteria group bacterium]|jgi:ABC-type glycerol-3-phosphate transport system substrate-binding protein